MELNDSLTNLLLCFILSLKFVPDTTVNADLNNFILESPDVNLRFFISFLMRNSLSSA